MAAGPFVAVAGPALALEFGLSASGLGALAVTMEDLGLHYPRVSAADMEKLHAARQEPGG